MSSYNTLVDVGFTIVHKYHDPHNIPTKDLIVACLKRLTNMLEDPDSNDANEAFGFNDTYECRGKKIDTRKRK